MRLFPTALPLFLLALASATLPALAADPPALPPAPETHILDRARIFKEEQATDLSRRLIALEHQHGISLHIAAYTFLTDESIDAHAIRLKESWVAGRNGLVIVYVRSTSQISFAASEQFKNVLSATDLMDIFTTAAATARDTQPENPAHYQLVTTATEAVISGLVSRVGTNLRAEKRDRSYLRHFVFGFGFLLILISVGGFLFLKFHREHEARTRATYYFPDVVVGQRFGAHHGGGVIAESDFARS